VTRTSVPDERLDGLARHVRAACLRAARDGYEQAGLSGLCPEGRWEMAIDSIRSLDLDAVIRSRAQTVEGDQS
jgi:hypothetical protein